MPTVNSNPHDSVNFLIPPKSRSAERRPGHKKGRHQCPPTRRAEEKGQKVLPLVAPSIDRLAPIPEYGRRKWQQSGAKKRQQRIPIVERGRTAEEKSPLMFVLIVFSLSSPPARPTHSLDRPTDRPEAPFLPHCALLELPPANRNYWLGMPTDHIVRVGRPNYSQ